MRQMVEAGEADALVPERVWREVSRGLMETKPSRMFEVLRACGALERVLPEVARLFGVPQRADYHPEVDTGVHLMMVLDMAARLGTSLAVRYACLGHDLGKGTTPPEILPQHLRHEERSVALVRAMSERLRVDNACRSLAELTAREHGNVHRSGEFGAAALVRLLERCDALRRPDRFAELLLACECDARGRLGLEEEPYPPRARVSPRPCAGSSRSTPLRSPPPPAPAARPARRSARRSTTRGWKRCAISGRRLKGAASALDEAADRHADQADQHAAAERQEPLPAEQAEAEVAGQPAEAVLLEPGADRVEDDQREEDDDEPADHAPVPTTDGAGRRRRSPAARTRPGPW